MRSPMFATVPLALILAVAPAQGQVSVGIHIDIPIIGHSNGGDYRRGPVREVRVYEYPPVPYGQWKKHYRDWNRVTLYVLDDRYYDYPVRGGRVVYVYRDNDRYFWGPGDGDWDRWDRWDGGRNDRDDRYRYDQNDRNRNGRDDRYEYRARPVPVYGHDRGRDGRNDGRYDGRDQDHRGDVRVAPQSRDQNGRGEQDRRPEAARNDDHGRGNDKGDKGRGNNGNGNGNGRGRRGN
ncbi:MAG: hypothetical protein V4558_04655 [Gemmatimonadota bacterium]